MRALRHTLLACCLALAAVQPVAAAEPVDVNSASAETIADAMSGVGLKRAQAIVEYRDRNGPFRSVDDLQAVRGIGPRLIDRSRDRLVVR